MPHTDTYKKLPRLFVDRELGPGQTVLLEQAQAHYLRNVLRRGEGDGIRLFNGRDGEWHARLSQLGKKTADATCDTQITPQPQPGPEIHLIFAPIKKNRMDMLVEKAVELGATHLHPVLTRNTEVRNINPDRLLAQITEAAEQCERLDRPSLSSLQSLPDFLTGWPKSTHIAACIERENQTAPLSEIFESGQSAYTVLIGPEGGFTAEEKALMGKQPDLIRPASLGPYILRAETAACYALTAIQICIDRK